MFYHFLCRFSLLLSLFFGGCSFSLSLFKKSQSSTLSCLLSWFTILLYAGFTLLSPMFYHFLCRFSCGQSSCRNSCYLLLLLLLSYLLLTCYCYCYCYWALKRVVENSWCATKVLVETVVLTNFTALTRLLTSVPTHICWPTKTCWKLLVTIIQAQIQQNGRSGTCVRSDALWHLSESTSINQHKIFINQQQPE